MPEDIKFSPNYAEYQNRYGHDLEGNLKRLHAAMDKWDRAIAEMLGFERPISHLSTADDTIPESIYEEALWLASKE